MSHFRPSLVFVLVSIASTSEAESASANCVVTSEQVAAGTSEQGVTLDDAACTQSFRHFVNDTFTRVRSSYEPYFEDLRADPETLEDLAWLIVRRDLLSTGWFARSESWLSHEPSATVAALLEETDVRLRQLLTHDEITQLENYRNSLPARELIQPMVSRLRSAGVPPTKEQHEHAVRDIHSWATGLMERAREEGADDIQTCEDAEAFTQRREAQLLGILSRSLEEDQMSIARNYYRERAEERERERKAREAASNEPCAVRYFNRGREKS
jgi:hypothetical protein